MAALRKALVTLFGGRGKLPKEEELDNVAEELFVQIRDAVIDDGGGDCITAKDLWVKRACVRAGMSLGPLRPYLLVFPFMPGIATWC